MKRPDNRVKRAPAFLGGRVAPSSSDDHEFLSFFLPCPSLVSYFRRAGGPQQLEELHKVNGDCAALRPAARRQVWKPNQGGPVVHEEVEGDYVPGSSFDPGKKVLGVHLIHENPDLDAARHGGADFLGGEATPPASPTGSRASCWSAPPGSSPRASRGPSPFRATCRRAPPAPLGSPCTWRPKRRR